MGCLFLLCYWNSLYILDIKPLLRYVAYKYFYPFVRLSFYFINNTLMYDSFKFAETHFIFFFPSVACTLVSYLRIHFDEYINPRPYTFMLCFCVTVVWFLAVIFRSLVHLSYHLHMIWCRDELHSFMCGNLVVPALFIE